MYIFFFKCYGDHRDLHVLTHSFPTRRSSDLAARDYNANRYHKPGDEDADSWKLDGVIEDLQALYGVGRVLVDGDQWPNWYEGNAFRAARDEMMAGNGDDASDGDQQEPGTDAD